ncbi:MAG: sigma 54-interacting transcriptional regulator [Deltaproteobacteria bacterium]|nr:sigma 54-interacting transcriptional regulator [Deltaproteobacteria bacterium]
MTTQITPVPRECSARRLRWLTLAYRGGLPNAMEEDVCWPLDGRRIALGRDPGSGGIALDDSRASRTHAELQYVPSAGTYRVIDLGSRNGTFVNGRRIEREDLVSGSVLRIGESLFVYTDRLIPEGLESPDYRQGNSLARSLAERAADLAAPTTIPIMIVGPTGAGKEVMASRIHQASGRKGALVAVNCATFGRDLIGSELFGHASGAFSGATSARAGLFQSAAGGTLFLDEIAELPLEQQPALLRALQEKKVRPVGADREVEVDVRVITATHRAMDRLHQDGGFREDLYARLAGFEIDLPGLSERREEVLPLFHAFLAEREKVLATEVAEVLLNYEWPQNVRELKHAAERARLFVQNVDVIGLTAMPSSIQKFAALGGVPRGEARPDRALSTGGREGEDLEAPTKDTLVRLLDQYEGNVAQVARETGKHRQQVYRWLKKYGIDASTYRAEGTEDVGG